jgi:uncharacterized protein (DUF488 family)
VFGEPVATIWSLGHSTRTWEEFLALLKEHAIEILADVRHFPSSQHVPWANRTSLEANLTAARIAYAHLPDLGGYRKVQPGSKNLDWRNPGFRGYADYMETPGFEIALGYLLEAAQTRRTAFMCAEAVPWRCHRALLSDALVARGVRVVHILAAERTQDHRLTAFAKVRGGKVTYPATRAKG